MSTIYESRSISLSLRSASSQGSLFLAARIRSLAFLATFT